MGMRNNDDVRALQNALLLEGLYRGKVDGNFGPLTRRAVIAFQAKYDLTQDGIVGTGTRAKLNELYGEGAGQIGARMITVLSPNRGETLAIGSMQVITWQTSGDIGTVFIQIYQKGVPESGLIISESIPNTGSFVWKVGQGAGVHQGYTAGAGSNYLIQVRGRGAMDPANTYPISDDSDSVFAMREQGQPISFTDLKVASQDAAAKSQLSAARAQAEIFYDYSRMSYANLCVDVQMMKFLDAASQAVAGNTTSDACNSSATAYAASTPMRSQNLFSATSGIDYWCVDSLGTSRLIDNPLGTATACPVASLMIAAHSQPVYSVTPTSLIQRNAYTFNVSIRNAPANTPIYFYLTRPDGSAKESGSNRGTTDSSGSFSGTTSATIMDGQTGWYGSWVVIDGKQSNIVMFEVKQVPGPVYSVTPTQVTIGGTYVFQGKVTGATPQAPVNFYLKRPDGTSMYTGQHIGTTNAEGVFTMTQTENLHSGQHGTYTSWLVVGGVESNRVMFTAN